MNTCMTVQMQTAMEQVSDQTGQLTVQLSAAAVAELELTEDDVSGAALGHRVGQYTSTIVISGY